MMEFESLARFASHLLYMAEAQRRAQRHAMEKAAQLVEREAKRRTGEYHDASGPFAGRAELAPSTKEDRLRRGFTENDPGLRTGKMRDSIQHTSNANEAAIGSNDRNLVFFELGTEKQPPRSVLGSAAAEKGEQVAAILGDGVMTALIGESVSGGKFLIRARE